MIRWEALLFAVLKHTTLNIQTTKYSTRPPYTGDTCGIRCGYKMKEKEKFLENKLQWTCLNISAI